MARSKSACLALLASTRLALRLFSLRFNHSSLSFQNFNSQVAISVSSHSRMISIPAPCVHVLRHPQSKSGHLFAQSNGVSCRSSANSLSFILRMRSIFFTSILLSKTSILVNKLATETSMFHPGNTGAPPAAHPLQVRADTIMACFSDWIHPSAPPHCTSYHYCCMGSRGTSMAFLWLTLLSSLCLLVWLRQWHPGHNVQFSPPISK